MSDLLKGKRIGYDVDGVLACFSCGVIKRAAQMGLQDKFPTTCLAVDCWDMSEAFSQVMKDAWEEPAFWIGLPRLLNENLPSPPDCYITSRRVPSEVTKQWLDKHHFPEAEVITVSHPSEKLAIIKERQLDVFVDDLYSTVRELRDAGINSILFAAPYQTGHYAECKGLPTIRQLTEIVKYLN